VTARVRAARCSTRSRLRLAATVVAGFVATISARQAHATPSAKLVYVRGPETAACPDESQLRRAVATRIGYDPFFATASKTVIAQISRVKTGYRGKIQIIGDDGVIRGERELATRGDDCSELISALALAVSIALDDLDDGAPAPAPAATAPAFTAPDAVAPTADAAPPAVVSSAADDGARAAPPPLPSSASRLGVAVSAGPVVSLGAAPGPSVGGAVAATLRYGWAALRVDLRADLPASGDLGGGGRVTASSLVGTAALCVRADVPFVCAGGGLGSFATTTESISAPASDHALLLQVLAVAGADVSLSRQLFVEPFAQLGVVLTRHRVFVDGIEAYRLPAVAATAGIHLGWRFL
jgi:hypothetical protein